MLNFFYAIMIIMFKVTVGVVRGVEKKVVTGGHDSGCRSHLKRKKDFSFLIYMSVVIA